MDEADLAFITEEHNLQRAHCMRQDALKKKPTLVPCGQCHNCNENLPQGALFCDNFCRDDWDREALAQSRNGRR